MIAPGVNAKALSTFLGHASVTITLDRYGHLFPGSEREAAGLLDSYLERSVGGGPREGALHETALFWGREGPTGSDRRRWTVRPTTRDRSVWGRKPVVEPTRGFRGDEISSLPLQSPV